jgi:hypothetical protein
VHECWAIHFLDFLLPDFFPMEEWAMRDHFRSLLGDDFEQELAGKLRCHVRRVAEELISKAEIMLDKEEKMEEVTISSSCREVKAKDDTDYREYIWLLHQLRVFLLSYSLLDNFQHKRPGMNSGKNRTAEEMLDEKKKFSARATLTDWPMVRLFILTIDCSCFIIGFFFFFFCLLLSSI